MIKKLQDIKWFKLIVYAVFSWLTAISLSAVSGYRITEINLVIPFLMVGAFSVIIYFDKEADKALWKSALCFAIPFALTLILGSGFDRDTGEFYGYTLIDVVYLVVLITFVHVLTIAALTLLNRIPQGEDKLAIKINMIFQNKSEKSKKRWVWFIAFVCCLIAWSPYYLTYFPGIVSKDYVDILNQCFGNAPLTNHHPILYVFFIKSIIIPCNMIGDMQFAVAIATTVQVILFASMLSYMVRWLYQKGCKTIGLILTVAFISINPVMAIFSLYITKDVLFGGIFLLYLLNLYDVVESKGAVLQTIQGFCRFLLLTLLVVFLRNNGIYITILMLVMCCIVYRSMWKKLLLCIAVVLLSYGLLKGPIFISLNIKGESFAEAMSIPLQQVAQTICDEGEMNAEDAAFLKELMPFERVKAVYTPGYTDPYKFDAAFNDAFLNQNKGEFLKVWARILPYNLDSYVKAYLIQTSGYWHIGETDSLNAFGVLDNNFGIKQNDLIKSVTTISIEPIIEKLILACRKAPIICFMTNMAFMVFLVYFVCICCWENDRKQYIIPLLPLLLLWATIMVAAPASCKFRYLFPFHLAYPVIIWLLLMINRKRGV